MRKIIPDDAVLVPDGAELKFKGMIFDVYQWPQKLFDGSEHTFEMLKRTDTVNALCVVEDRVVVLNDEQPHLGKRLSFPGGRVDDSDESQLSAVQREVREETGYSFKKWRLVWVWQPYRKIEWFNYIFIAWDINGQDKPHLDPGEKIELKQLSFEEVKDLSLKQEGYIGNVWPLLEHLNDLDDLLALPEFQGREVER